MIDSVKDYLAPKRFGIVAYVCTILHVLAGLAFTGVVLGLSLHEIDRFTCNVSPESSASYSTRVNKECYASYQLNYNSPLPFYGFVLLSIWLPIVVAVVYSLSVRSLVDRIESNYEDGVFRNSLYVFYFYFCHLVVRVIAGILFTVLQYSVLFPNGFTRGFDCHLRSPASVNHTYLKCENTVAPEKKQCWITASVLNMLFAMIMFVEILQLYQRFPICSNAWNCEAEFILVYLLRKEYSNEPVVMNPTVNNDCHSIVSVNNTNIEHPCVGGIECDSIVNVDSTEIEHPCLEESVQSFKKQVLQTSRTSDVICGPKTGLDELYTQLLIHTEQVSRHALFEDMSEYATVPLSGTCLNEVRELFLSGEDTKGKRPRKILAVGRPGIGKTVLSEKILRDWARGVDNFYEGKIAFAFKFRWFNSNELREVNLNTFLRYGTELSDEKFEVVYDYISQNPESAILVFDGFDEFNGDVSYLDKLHPPNDASIPMSAFSLFIKLLSGRLLQDATVVVTSRTTASEFYSRFTFDRTVEIVGFTKTRIEEFVEKFCDSHKRSDLMPKIWKHIQTLPQLLSLCYIPVNCFIVSSILFECLKEAKTLPETLTDLYDAAVVYFDKHHNKSHQPELSEATKKLQRVAYEGIERGQLLFSSDLFDDQMKKSGLLHSVSNPYSQAQTQFCFIHLTIQEFLAARQLIDAFPAEKIKEFISSRIEDGRWYLVLQFVAGLLAKRGAGYKDCVMEFAKSFSGKDGILDLSDHRHLLIMKCLKEAADKDIAENACEETPMQSIVTLKYTTMLGSSSLSLSDWEAVTFICKYMQNVKKIYLDLTGSSVECYLKALKLLQKRCVEELTVMGDWIYGSSMVDFRRAFLESNCAFQHQHSNLRELIICSLVKTNEDLSKLCDFFKNGNGSCLEKLGLVNMCGFDSDGLTPLLKILEDGTFPLLTHLYLCHSNIEMEDVIRLCDSLRKRKTKISHINLDHCVFYGEDFSSDVFMLALVELITDDGCNITELSLSGNALRDSDLKTLCANALTHRHCKLTKLNLIGCPLTDNSVPILISTLQSRNCRLLELNLGNCRFSQKGKNDLREIDSHELGLTIYLGS